MSVMQLRATIIPWDTQKIICLVLYFQKKSFGKTLDSKISKANIIPTRILTFKKKKKKKKEKENQPCICKITWHVSLQRHGKLFFSKDQLLCFLVVSKGERATKIKSNDSK